MISIIYGIFADCHPPPHATSCTGARAGDPVPDNVTSIAAAPSGDAPAHFERLFSFETESWNVHDPLSCGPPG
jgi:hypothetical protein